MDGTGGVLDDIEDGVIDGVGDAVDGVGDAVDDMERTTTGTSGGKR